MLLVRRIQFSGLRLSSLANGCPPRIVVRGCSIFLAKRSPPTRRSPSLVAIAPDPMDSTAPDYLARTILQDHFAEHYARCKMVPILQDQFAMQDASATWVEPHTILQGPFARQNLARWMVSDTNLQAKPFCKLARWFRHGIWNQRR